MYKNYQGVGTQRLAGKRKRGRSSEPNDSGERPAKRLAGDVGVVVEHCESASAGNDSNIEFCDAIRR